MHGSAALTISTKVFRNQLDQRFATLKIEFDTATKDKENVLLTPRKTQPINRRSRKPAKPETAKPW